MFKLKRTSVIIALLFIGLSSKAYDFQKDGIYYNINSDKKTVSVSEPEYSSPYSGDITIPEKVTDNNGKEYIVTAIDQLAFRNCSKLTSVCLPEGLKEIDAPAFNNCINLKEINIPSSVEIIRGNFSNCTSLPVIDGIRYADTYLIEVVDTLSTYAIKDGTRWIGSEAFKDCSFITNIELPEGLTEIQDEAFSGCIGLTNIELPEGLTEIQDEAFSGCTGLTNIVLPNSMKILKEGVFAECTGLTEITIGTNLISITGDYGTFENCTNLKTINFNAVRCRKDGKGWNNAFEGCNNVETINIGDSVRTIGQYLFGGDNGFKVKNIYMGANVDTIWYSAFYNCYFDTMFMSSENPPVLMDDKSLGTHNSLTRNIVVPCGSAENYKNAQYYKNYNIIENCSGLNDIKNNSISVYPNPANDKVTVTADRDVMIINSLGKTLKVFKDVKGVKEINVSDLESGVYYVKIGETTKKLIVQ